MRLCEVKHERSFVQFETAFVEIDFKLVTEESELVKRGKIGFYFVKIDVQEVLYI